jgi:phosphonoacetate hydrolase
VLESFACNGREYRYPRRPTIAICIDGTAPAYLEDALERDLMPRLEATLAAGAALLRADAQVPTVTNANNATIVTGVSAAVHGIAGNHYLAPDGSEVQLTDPAALRAETIHAAAQQAGVAVLVVTAKDKLTRLLGAGGVPAISAERAHEQTVPGLDGQTGAAALGVRNPNIYDPGLSAYTLDLALHLAERLAARLVYCSLTDYVQHKAAPGEPLADEFYRGLDERFGRALDAGWVIGMVADHGMNPKTLPDGSPNVRYLRDALTEAGIESAHVLLPITDPYVVHHGALGSIAWVYVCTEDRARARRNGRARGCRSRT